MYTDSDRLRELAAIRSIWVETRLERFVNASEGMLTDTEYREREGSLYRQWRDFYPALNSLFPSHLPAEATS